MRAETQVPSANPQSPQSLDMDSRGTIRTAMTQQQPHVWHRLQERLEPPLPCTTLAIPYCRPPPCHVRCRNTAYRSGTAMSELRTLYHYTQPTRSHMCIN